MTPDISQKIHDINQRHIRNVDKLGRMYSGLASNIEDYSPGNYLRLRVVNTEKYKPSDDETARNIVSAWMEFNPELRTVTLCEVDMYKTNKPLGFAFSLKELPKERLDQIEVEMRIEEKLEYVTSILIVPLR